MKSLCKTSNYVLMKKGGVLTSCWRYGAVSVRFLLNVLLEKQRFPPGERAGRSRTLPSQKPLRLGAVLVFLHDQQPS